MSGNKVSKLRQGFFKSQKVGLAGKGQAVQVGALCTRVKDDKLEVLLITSRRTRRWVIPKGWPMLDLSDGEAAAQEAWEEAGVADCKIGKKPIGKYKYLKTVDGGGTIPIKVRVYRMKVQEMKKNFPERNQRSKVWVSPKRAAKMVREPGLKKILLGFHKT